MSPTPKRPCARDADGRAAKKARAYRAGGVGDELDEASFVNFYLAMASELLVRIGDASDNPYERRLPPMAARRFREIRRCTFSWLTDRTTLALLAHLAEEAPARTGHAALRSIILAQLTYTSAEVFEAMEPASDGGAAEVARSLRDHFVQEAAACGRPAPRKSPISKALQTGTLGCLGRSRGAIIDKVANFVEGLRDAIHVAWPRVRDGDVAATLEAAEGLRLPRFRAHCVARLLWLHSGGKLGTSPQSFHVGFGASDALRRLLDADELDEAELEAAFAKALPRWREAVAAADEFGVVAALDRLGLFPASAQTYEHLLCEAGKVFGVGHRERRGLPKPGYAELFLKARRFLADPKRRRTRDEA